jgi:glycosyltransferase involved in cell wall biosynthesis
MSRRSKPMISFLMPALNEEAALPTVIKSIPVSKLKTAGYSVEIVVVDNASTDNTAKVAKKLGARVVKERKRGYGAAYKKGFKSVKGDIIITGDADNTYPFKDALKFIKILEKEDLEFITTNRFSNMGKKSMTFRNRFGNYIFRTATNILFGLKLEDSWSGMWIFRTKALKHLNITSDGMPLSQEIKIEAFKKFGVRAKEIPINFTNVRIGEAKLEPWKDGVRTLKFFARKKLGLLR